MNEVYEKQRGRDGKRIRKFVRGFGGKVLLGRPRIKLEDNIKMGLRNIVPYGEID
jgi:hypothetical protein